jgi:hypothetical protein
MLLSLSLIECPIRHVAQARVDHFSKLVVGSTITVAIGVALEAAEIIDDAAASCIRRLRRRRELLVIKELEDIFPAHQTIASNPHRDHHPLAKWLMRIGVILVVLGVIGEWEYGANLEDANRKLHVFDMALVDGATESARIARGEADAATAASGKAQDTANAANRASGQAGRTAESAETLANNVKSDLVIASAELRTLQKNLEFVAKGQGQRAIPDDPIKQILRKSPAGKLLILYQESSDESYMVADQLRGDIRDAGWNVPAKPSPFKSTVELFPKCGMSAHDILLVAKEGLNGVGQTPAQAMYRAIVVMANSGYVRSFASCVNDQLPDDTVELYVSPRP